VFLSSRIPDTQATDNTVFLEMSQKSAKRRSSYKIQVLNKLINKRG
jgi:hypothetical protein